MLRIERDNRLSRTEKWIFASGCVAAAAMFGALLVLAMLWADLNEKTRASMAEHQANKERLAALNANHSDTLETITTAIEAQRRLRAMVQNIECNPFQKGR